MKKKFQTPFLCESKGVLIWIRAAGISKAADELSKRYQLTVFLYSSIY